MPTPTFRPGSMWRRVGDRQEGLTPLRSGIAALALAHLLSGCAAGPGDSALFTDATGGVAGSATTPRMSAAGAGGSSHAGASGNAAQTSSGGSRASGGSGGAAGSGSNAVAGSGGAAPCPRKRGVAYGFDPPSASADMSVLHRGVDWFYGWSIAPSAAAKSAYGALGLEFVPMVWGGNFDATQLSKNIPQGSKYLLGFNEPNFGAQANLTPEQAAALWPALQQIAKDKQLKLVSPAVNYCDGNCNRTDPFQWLDDFFAACPGCQVDYVAAHWYACTLDALQNYVRQLKKYKKPIWLTEFACADGGPHSVDEVAAYAAQASAWLEQEPAVFRYAWFSGRTDNLANVNLLGDPGMLSVVGTNYVNEPAVSCP